MSNIIPESPLEQTTLAALRDALLPKLMRGEVRVRLSRRRNASP